MDHAPRASPQPACQLSQNLTASPTSEIAVASRGYDSNTGVISIADVDPPDPPPNCPEDGTRLTCLRTGRVQFRCDVAECSRENLRLRFHCATCGRDYCTPCTRRIGAMQTPQPTQPTSTSTPRTQPRHAHQAYEPQTTRTHRCYREVPQCLSDIWAAALLQAASLAMQRLHEDDARAVDMALLLFIDLPGNRLRKAARGGKARTSRRLRATISLPVTDAWVEEDAEDRSTRLTSQLERTTQLARAGLFSKAAQSLFSSTRANLYDGNDAASIIEELHPQEKQVQSATFNTHDVALRMEEVVKRCKARGVAPGPSGWTWELLAPLFEADQVLCLSILELLARRFLSHDCHTLLRQRLTASRLILLRKKNDPAGRPRPVAVGEFFLRCISHACLPHHLTTFFEPEQIGVGTKGGVERAAHWAREQVEVRRRTLVTLDLRNAFNTVLRSAMAEQLSEAVKQHPHWAAACALFNAAYVTPSLLLSQEWGTFFSSRGSRQGCVFGGFLFALVLQPTLRRLRARYPMLDCVAYLDDKNIALDDKHIDDFLSFFDDLKSTLRPLGLEFTLSKCVYLRPDGVRHPALDSLGFKAEPSSIRVLGSFVGNVADVRRRLELKVQEHAEFFHLLRAPEIHAGVAFDVLRFCGVPRVCHMTRTHPPAVTAGALALFDDMAHGVMTHLLQLTPEAASSEITTAHFSLPMALGGFGVTRYSELATIAYTASVEAFGTQPVAEATTQRQRTTQHVLHKKEELLQRLDTSGRARLLSCEGKGCWLHHSSHMPSTVAWRTAAQIRLHADITGAQRIRCQPCQKDISAIAFADHVMCCRHLGHYTAVHRHDLVANVITAVLREYGCVIAAAHTGMHDDGKRADFIVTAPNLATRLCVDVSVTHPCADTNVRSAAQDAGHAAASREQAKEAKHGEAARAMYGNFSPWVFETFGRWGAAFRRDVALLETAVGPRRALQLRHTLRRHLAIAIQVGNADMVMNALRTATTAQQAATRPVCFLLPAARALIETPAGTRAERPPPDPSGMLLGPAVRL